MLIEYIYIILKKRKKRKTVTKHDALKYFVHNTFRVNIYFETEKLTFQIRMYIIFQ